jgi:hypothetical protein
VISNGVGPFRGQARAPVLSAGAKRSLSFHEDLGLRRRLSKQAAEFQAAESVTVEKWQDQLRWVERGLAPGMQSLAEEFDADGWLRV